MHTTNTTLPPLSTTALRGAAEALKLKSENNKKQAISLVDESRELDLERERILDLIGSEDEFLAPGPVLNDHPSPVLDKPPVNEIPSANVDNFSNYDPEESTAAKIKFITNMVKPTYLYPNEIFEKMLVPEPGLKRSGTKLKTLISSTCSQLFTKGQLNRKEADSGSHQKFMYSAK